MAQNNKPLYTLYESLKSDNYDVPDNYDSFERTLTAPGAEGTNSRLALYKSLKDDGYDVPDTYDSFANTLFSAKPRERDVQQQAVNAEAALTPVGNTDPMTIAANFGESSRKMVEDTRRMSEANTPAGRKKQQGLEIAGRMAGRNTRLPGLSVAMPTPEQPEASDGAQAAPKAQDMRGPQYYGTVVDPKAGQLNAQWLMPDGSLTTDFYEADVAAGEARSARLQREFERRMAINGLDTSKPEDVAAQQAYDRLAQLETRAKMHSDEKLAKLEERYEKAGAMERGQMLIGQSGNTATSMVTMPASVYGNGIYDDEDKLIAAERKNLEDAITAHHAGKLKKTGSFFAAQNLVNAWEGVKDVFKDGDTYTAGMISMHQSAQMLAIKAKLDKGEALTRGEESLLESMLVKQTIDENVEKPHGYTMGYTIANMVPFMIQMAMNPAAGAGGKLGNMAVKEFAKMMAKRAGQRAAKGFMMKAVARLGKKRAAAIAKGIGVTAGDIVASAGLANTLQAPATMADAALRHAGDVAYDKDGTLHFENGEGVIKAFAKAEGAMLIEDYTEMLGAHFGVIGGAIGRGTGKAVRKLGGGKLLDNVMKLCANIRATDWAKGIAAIERRAQWNGSVGEVLEEEAGIVLNSIFTGDNSISDLWDKEQQIDIVLGVGAFGAFVSGIKTAGYPIARHKARKALDERVATCEASFGKNWDSIREAIDMADEADLARTIARLGRRYATTPEKAKALLEYASAMAKARAFNIASASAEEMQTNPEQRQIDQSYNNGYTAEGSGRVDVQNLYNARRERAINTLDADTMRNLDANPLATLSGMASAGTYTDEELSVAREYAAAKSAYDGMQQSVEDEIEAQIWRCNAAIDARTNRDTGMVQRATYGLENREVYIIKGNVVADENGVIDRSASDDTIAIVDLETGETKMVASKDLGQAEQPIAAEQFRSSMAAYVRQEIGDRARAQAEGRLLFEENEKCLILDDEGSQSEVTILGGATDEQGAPIADAVKVQYADGTTGVVAMSELQEQVNAAAAARMDYAEQELQQGAAARAAVDAEVDTDAEQDGLAVEDGGQRRSFALNDEVELIADQGGVTSGMITGEIDSDGLIEVQTDKPVNGQMVNRLTLDELMQLLTRHNGEIVDEAEVEGEPETNGSNESNSAEVDDGFIPIDTELIPTGGVDTAEEQPAADTTNEADVTDVSNVTDTAGQPAEATELERLPKNEKGEPIFEEAESPEAGWDALVEFSDGDVAAAKENADMMAEIKRKALEKVRKQKSKGDNPTAIRESQTAIAAALAKAEQEYDFWIKVASVEQGRKAEERRREDEAARARARERAEAEKAEREAREEAARQEREALEGIPEWHLDTPEDARKRGARRYGGQLFTRQEPVVGVVGRGVEVKFSQSDLPKGRIVVMDASQLQPSHIQGERNPMFFIDEAQPKNRAEAVSKTAAKEMAENIRPQEITGGATAYTGAPTINARGEVIQGNNRSDALRYLWENSLPGQQQTYKQYLIDNAERFDLDPEAIRAMERPVLVNMLDVDDAEAIRLGQMTAQDTESGGTERIKPKNVAQKLGEDMRAFASQLLKSGDEEATFGQLVDRNGAEVLKWMAQKGVITDTQYQSAFDSKGNLTAEAKNDLQKVLYQAVFKGGSQQLEEMFDALPAKAQRAILSTAFRDMDSPFAGKMLPEIQASIAAYHQLMRDPAFAASKKLEGLLRAVETFKQVIELDDRFEQYAPADNFSNFALHLAAMYKAGDMSQTTLAGYFNQMYDLAQGKKAATLFEADDTTEYPLADVIKQVLNIDYQPAKNGNNNVANGGADVALRNQDGQGGELRGNEPPASGEQNSEGAESSERGTGIAGDGRGSGNRQTRGSSEAAASQESLSKEEASGIIAEMEERAEVAPEIELTIENWDAEFGESGIVSTPIGDVKMGENQFTKLMRQGRNGKLGMVKPTLENPDIIIEDNSEAKEPEYTERKSSYVYVKTFIKPDGSRYYYFTSVTVSKDGHEVVISNQEKRRNVLTNLLIKGKLVWKHADDVSSASDVADGLYSPQGNMSEPASEGTDAPQTNNVFSKRKVTNSASDKQESREESSAQPADSKGEQTIQTAVEAASAQVNTTPTPAQAEAGNYKKGHVTIGEFDITIENPADSVRKGADADGKEWSNTMANAYGYIKGTEGVDGDHIDVFLHENMDQWNGRKVFVVDQTNTDGSFDEHKVMLGFNDKAEAMQAYLANYDKAWADTHPGLRISETSIGDFNKWVQSSHRKTKPFADYKSVDADTTEVSAAARIEGAEKLSAERCKAVERYGEGHYCVPICVIADEADIRESGLSEVAVAQMMAALTEEDVPAVYCREDKKIYIFAGHKDSNVGSTLAHENFHALTDAIGDARENRYMLDEYRYLLLADLDHGEDFSRIWKAVADAYPPHKRAEEFVAYTVGLMYVSEGAAKAIRRILDGNAKSSIFQQLINPILYGTQTKTDAYRSANSENRRGGGAGVQQGRAGNSQAEGRADGEESAGGEVANEPRRRYVARKQATTTGMSLFDWADAEERERREVTTKDEKAIAAEEANAAIDGFVENYSRWLEHSVEIEAQLDAEGVEGELRDELAAQMESEEAGIAEERDKLEEKLRDYYALDNTPDDATKIAHDMVGRVQAEVEIRHRKEHILSDLLNGSDEAPIETTSDEVAAEEKTAEVKTGGGFISYNALGHLPDAKEGEFAYVERKFSRTGEFSFTGADKIRDRGDVAYLFRSLENYSVENVFAVLVKDGKARVLHIGMGTATSSLADMSAIRAGVDAFGADRIYLIHNHPSGTMVASQQDRNLMRTLEAAFGDKIDVSGIIIDTTSGRYVEFDGEGQAEVYDRPRQSDGDKMADVFHFDQADRSNMPEETMAIRSSSDVANAIGNLRFGEGKKVSYLILAHNGHVIGNFHTGYTDINASGLAEELASVASKYGGTSVVVYGNMPLDGVMRLKDAVARHSLGAVRLLDTLGVRNGIQMSAVDEGMLYEDGIPYGPAEVREPMVAARGREAFDALRDRAVAERGIVMPGLNEKVVRVVEVPRHDFAGTGKEALNKALVWAKKNIVGVHSALDNDGREFNYSISNDAVEKYVSRSATSKSDNIGVHLAALKKLPEIIKESIEVEIHADYKKLSGERSAQNEVNVNALIHRFFGVVNIDGNLYRVKTTMREYADVNMATVAHSYEITQIELLEAPSDSTKSMAEPLAMTSNSSKVEPTVNPKDSGVPHRIANLLKGVEKSYDPGKKLLEESEKSELFRRGDERVSVADYSKIKKSVSASSQGSVGRDRFSEKRQAEFAAQEREHMAAHIRELAERLHLDNVEVVTDASQLEGVRATAKGFFNKRTGKITIVLPNNLGTIDAEQTLLHEAVAHYGLRRLFGEHFDAFLDNVYESATEEIRRKIAEMAARNGWNFRTATEEYLAGLAENTDFESISRDAAGQSWWAKVKQLFIDMVEKVGLKGFRDKVGVTLTDNELRYILWRSYANLAEPGATRSIFGEAADIAKQSELKVGNYAEGGIEAEYVEPEYVSAVNERFNEQLERWSSGVMRPEEVVQVGVPTGILSSLMPTVPILLRQKVLSKSRKKHGLSAAEMKNLPEALGRPIFVFKSSPETISVLTELKSADGNNLFVAIELGKDLELGGRAMIVNDILTIHGREIENVVLPILHNDSLVWADKKKGLEWLRSAKSNSQANTSQTLDDAAKKVKEFENPKLEEEELYRPGDFSPRDTAIARKEYERMVSSGGFQFQEAMQDSMLGLKKFYQAILGNDTQIEDVAGFENAYLFENRMSSMNAGEQHEYFRRFMEPLLKEIAKIAGANQRKRKELTDYLMAKHGLERNEHMRTEAAANGENADRDFAGLIGLTGEADWASAEATAKQWVDDYEKLYNTADLWKAINNATKATLEKVYLSGIISKKTYEEVRDMYEYYIPLRGWNETTSDQVYGYLTSKDGPLGGSIIKKAEGRSSMADDPIATIAMMADDAIRQGNRNLMKQRFLNFVLNHPSDVASVHDIWLEYDDVADEWRPVFADVEATDTADEVAQKVEAFEQRMESLKAAHPDKYKKGREAQHIPYKVVKNNLREHQVLIKRNGQTFVVTINGNPRAAQALNGLTNPDVELNNAVGDLLKLATWANRQLSAFYTTRNPDFVVSNFMRDMLYANCMTWVKESPRYALRFHKNFGKFAPISPRRLVRFRKGPNGGTVYSTGMLLRKWENGTLDMTDKYEKYFYEFMINGGETGYTNVRDIEGHKRAVATELKKQSSVGRQAWAALGMQLDLLNRSVENCARFAAFVTSREFGRSIDRAIYDAKEVSVNFNKKGSGAKMAKAVGQTNLGKFAAYLGGSGRLVFIFWNAGIQGMANFGRQAKRHPAKFAAGATAMFTLGYIIPILAEMMGGGDGDDDDKNAYYNLPEYVRRSNICFRAGNQWISIPLPIEYRAMYGLGELAYGVTSGNERYSNKELAREIAAQVSQILPIDMLEGGGGWHAFIPSLFKPVTEAYLMNEGWTGLPIYRDNAFNKNDPEWTKAYASADNHLVDFTRWLNETTGGNDYKKGDIDINPAKLEYLLSGTFGGLFTFPNKGEKMRETMFGDREFEWRNMPIANRLIKSGDERTAYRKLQNEYYKYLEEYKETKRLYRKYEKADESGVLGYAERLDFLENSPEFLRAEIFDDFKDIIDANDNALNEETDKEIRAEIEAEQLADKRELVNALNDPEAYFRSLREAGMLSDDYMNYLERSFGMKLRIQGQ